MTIIMNSNNSKTFILVFTICLLSIFSSLIIVANSSTPNYFEYLPLLPLSFGFASLTFYNLYRKCFENLAVCLILGGYFIKNVIGPLTLTLGEFQSMFFINSEVIVNKAIGLMVYEVFFVFAVLLLYFNTNEREKENSFKQKYNLTIKNNITDRTFNLIFWTIIGYITFVVFYIPEVKTLYTTIFSNDNIIEVFYDYDSIVERGGIKRPLMTLFVIAVGFMRYFIPAYFMIKIRNKVGENTIGLIYSIPFVFLQFMVVGATNAESVFGVIVSAILLSILYPSKIKLIINFFIILGILAFTYIMILKITAFSNWTGSEGISSIAETIQAYFPGVVNIAAAFNIENPSKLSTLFFDIYSTIPFRGSFFNLEEIRLVIVYNQQNGVSGQIIPFISQSEHYLGPILAPILPAVFAVLAVKMNYKIRNENNIWKIIALSFLLVLFSITPSMYNFTISLSIFFNVFIPMFLISKVSRKIRL